MNILRFKSNQAGITLPEALIALMIFAVVGVTFTAALGTNFKVLTMADQRTTSEALAKSKLEAINKAAYSSSYDNITVDIPAGYVIETDIVLIDPLNPGTVSGTDVGMQKVTVTITCQQCSPPNTPVIVVDSYKRNPEKIE